MAGNPYTESGEAFKVPDMLANRADIYNLGDIMSGMEEVFALSYIENSLTSNAVLAPLANRDLSDVHRLIKMAKAVDAGDAGSANLLQAQSSELTYPYSSSEVNEIIAILRHMFTVQEVILDVNQAYIASASQDDKYRVEPIFKLQGSYRNMNKMTEKLSAVMNDDELNQLIDDHYLGESQLLTQGAESNLLKLGEMRGELDETQKERWMQIKTDFLRNKAMGGADGDVGARIVAQLVDVVGGFKSINEQFANYLMQNDPEQIASLREAEQQVQRAAQLEAGQLLADSFANGFVNNAKVVSESINNGFEQSLDKLTQIYRHDHKIEGEHLQQTQALQQQLVIKLITAVEQLADSMSKNMAQNIGDSLSKSLLDSGVATVAEKDTDRVDPNEQTAVMANALKQALEPLAIRMDEKLVLDSSTEQSGKLIVDCLNRLNKIFDEHNQ